MNSAGPCLDLTLLFHVAKQSFSITGLFAALSKSGCFWPEDLRRALCGCPLTRLSGEKVVLDINLEGLSDVVS